MLKKALTHAKLGYRVHPVRGKRPLLKSWPERATTDRDQIKTWWSKWPTANVGIATGGGLAVLDVDPRNGGDESLDAFEREHGELPETRTVRTGGGGWHYYFSEGVGLRSGELAPGL